MNVDQEHLTARQILQAPKLQSSVRMELDCKIWKIFRPNVKLNTIFLACHMKTKTLTQSATLIQALKQNISTRMWSWLLQYHSFSKHLLNSRNQLVSKFRTAIIGELLNFKTPSWKMSHLRPIDSFTTFVLYGLFQYWTGSKLHNLTQYHNSMHSANSDLKRWLLDIWSTRDAKSRA